jgi:hypothetical protein
MESPAIRKFGSLGFQNIALSHLLTALSARSPARGAANHFTNADYAEGPELAHLGSPSFSLKGPVFAAKQPHGGDRQVGGSTKKPDSFFDAVLPSTAAHNSARFPIC